MPRRSTRPLPRLFAVVACLVLVPLAARAQVQTPQQFFGTAPGADGELVRYPKVLEYMQHLAKSTDRVAYEELGKTTMGHPYVLVTISSPQNLAKRERYLEISRRLADPRGLSEQEAKALAAEGRPFFLLYTSIHATEVGNFQAMPGLAYRLATESSPEIREILDNVVLLLVPSQNPDGQVMVIDHWYKTKGTPYTRVYPDLYHKYVGHDNNRDWFMFTQVETRLAIQLQNKYKPVITHDMHQQGSTGSRIFVPPFDDPYDPNIHPILAQQQAQIGLAMAGALTAAGKTGVAFLDRYDLWTPARQYMVYHGQPRILTEIASVNLADPFVSPDGKPLGPQESRMNFIEPYRDKTWRLGQIVDYAQIVAMAGISHVAKYRTTWLENFYKVHRDWVARKDAPYAFVLPANQRDPFSTLQLLDIMRTGDVEVHRAGAAFTAGGRAFPAGSWVIKIAQPYGAFAKTMLEKQVYPDLRLFPGGPPKPPYDVTGHTLGYLMGVEVVQVDAPFDASLEPVREVRPAAQPLPARPKWAYVYGPESNAAFIALARLQKAAVPVFRAATGFDAGGASYAPGSWIVAPTPQAASILGDVAKETGLAVGGADRPVAVNAFRVKPATRIGLWKAANNMAAGWMWWLFEQYGFNHQLLSAQDFTGDLAAKYDTIVLPNGTSRRAIVEGLDPKRNDKEWAWAYGVGEDGWKKLGDWVRAGGTLVAIGDAVETARELLGLPIERALPQPTRRRGPAEAATAQAPDQDANRVFRDAFQSPASLLAAIRERVVEPSNLFYCPGSLLQNEFDTSHPVAWGMPPAWPVFFESDQAWRLTPGFGVQGEVVARYPKQGPILQSGWLLGEDLLRDQANVVAFRLGKGYVVTIGSQVDYRTQPRGTFKLFFNAMFHGPSLPVSASELAKLR